jgi:uncharacterized membrane protein
LQAIGDLISYRIDHSPVTRYTDADQTPRIFAKEKSFDDIFNEYVLPVWDYGKDDRLVQTEMQHILTLLSQRGSKPAISKLLNEVQSTIKISQTKR